MSILCVGISSFAIFIVAAEDETPEDECIVGKQFPEGFGVEKSSVSPDGRYGVLVPLDFDHFDENEHENKLVEIKTGRSLAVIDGGTGKAGFLNHSGIASNPKAIEDFPKDAEVNTELEASIDASGKLTVKNFK